MGQEHTLDVHTHLRLKENTLGEHVLHTDSNLSSGSNMRPWSCEATLCHYVAPDNLNHLIMDFSKSSKCFT